MRPELRLPRPSDLPHVGFIEGAAGDGVTDDTAAVQAAMPALLRPSYIVKQGPPLGQRGNAGNAAVWYGHSPAGRGIPRPERMPTARMSSASRGAGMSEQKHDPLCPYWTFYDDDCPHSPCQCELIAEVREAVAKKIEAKLDTTSIHSPAAYRSGLQQAARIARGSHA